MKTMDLRKNREVKDDNKEKRSLMYSQIFNYNITRDGTRTIDVSAAVAGGGKSITSKKNYYIGLVVIVIVIALCFGWSFAHDGLALYIHNYLLVENDVEMQLEEPGFVDMDVEAFLEGAMKGPSYAKDVEECYSKYYNQWQDVPVSGGGEHVSEDDSLKFNSYRIVIYSESKIGKVEIKVSDVDAKPAENFQYFIQGSFKIADYTAEDTILGVKEGLADFSYKAENGNKAYFVKNEADEVYNVYFEVNDILYEMEIPASNKAVENAKKIFGAM